MCARWEEAGQLKDTCGSEAPHSFTAVIKILESITQPNTPALRARRGILRPCSRMQGCAHERDEGRVRADTRAQRLDSARARLARARASPGPGSRPGISQSRGSRPPAGAIPAPPLTPPAPAVPRIGAQHPQRTQGAPPRGHRIASAARRARCRGRELGAFSPSPPPAGYARAPSFCASRYLMLLVQAPSLDALAVGKRFASDAGARGHSGTRVRAGARSSGRAAAAARHRAHRTHRTPSVERAITAIVAAATMAAIRRRPLKAIILFVREWSHHIMSIHDVTHSGQY